MNTKFVYPVIEKTYKKIGDKELRLFIFKPQIKEADKPVIVFFHGGGFTKSNCTFTQFQHHAHFFSTIGLVAVCVEYRTAYDEPFSPINSIQDAKAAIRWIRQNYLELGIDPNKTVVSGGSSGGYMALCCACIENYNNQGEDLSVSCMPNALVLYNAGVDFKPLMRLYPQLEETAKDLSPIHQIKEGLPPSLFFHGTKDANIDIQQIQHFCNLMVENGNQSSLVPFEGMGHGFFNYGAYENKPFLETNWYTEKFLKELEYIR